MRQDPRYIGQSLFNLGLAHFCLGQYGEAVNFLERSVTHIPEFTDHYAFLAASYAHFGRDQEAKIRLSDLLTRSASPMLWRRMQRLAFKDQEVADRLSYGLIKAGLIGEPSEYYKLFEKNRLTGNGIKQVMFGRTCSGILVKEVEVDISKNGETTFRGGVPPDKGRIWIDGDMFCFEWKVYYNQCRFLKQEI